VVRYKRDNSMIRTRSPIPGRRVRKTIQRPLPTKRSQQVAGSEHQGQQAPKDGAGVLADELPPVEEQLRQPRQRATTSLVHPREARHDIAHQEEGHATADDEQDGRVDGRADHPVADCVEPRLVVDVARQRPRQVAGSLGSPDDTDVEWRKDIRLASQGSGKTLALAQICSQPLKHLPRYRRSLFLEQRLEGLDQAESRLQQSEQFGAEQQD
jgi:hypothetical protein